MSSTIFTNLVRVVVAENITLDVVVSNHRGRLGEYVRQVLRDKGLKHREVEKRAGGRISHSYISKIISGAAGNLTDEKYEALAIGLDVSEEELRAQARGVVRPAASEFEETLLRKFRQLPPEWQPDLIQILDVLLRQHVEPAREREIFHQRRQRAAKRARRRAAA